MAVIYDTKFYKSISFVKRGYDDGKIHEAIIFVDYS